MRDRSRRVRLAALLVAMAVALAACSGPQRTLEVGVKEYPTDVIFGGAPGQPEQFPAVPPSRSVNPGFPAFIQPPPPVNRPPAQPEVECPPSHPLDAPKDAASIRAVDPPKPGTYVFRNKGTSKIGDQEGAYPSSTRRTIRNIVRTVSSFGFHVDEEIGDVTTTTRYRVYANQQTSEGQTIRSGIYIEQIVTRRPNGEADSFTPGGALGPGVLILPFPADPGTQWDASGSDPLGGTMAFRGQVGIFVQNSSAPAGSSPVRVQAKARVNACGEPLEGWYVLVGSPNPNERNDFTGEWGWGRFVNPATNTNLNLRPVFVIAPQFGGISIMDHLEIAGIDRGIEVNSVNDATINSRPARP